MRERAQWAGHRRPCPHAARSGAGDPLGRGAFARKAINARGELNKLDEEQQAELEESGIARGALKAMPGAARELRKKADEGDENLIAEGIMTANCCTGKANFGWNLARPL